MVFGEKYLADQNKLEQKILRREIYIWVNVVYLFNRHIRNSAISVTCPLKIRRVAYGVYNGHVYTYSCDYTY